MVVEAHFWQTTTIAKVTSDGGGSPFLAKLPPSPKPQPMVAEVRFGPTATIAMAATIGAKKTTTGPVLLFSKVFTRMGAKML